MTHEERIIGAMVVAALKRYWSVQIMPHDDAVRMYVCGDTTITLNLTGGTEMITDAEGPDEVYDAMIDAAQNACNEIWSEQ